MSETLQRGDDENTLDGPADRAEAYAMGIEIIDVSSGISRLEIDANLPYSIMRAAGRNASHDKISPYDK